MVGGRKADVAEEGTQHVADVMVYGPGEVVGDVALLGKPAVVSYVADTEVELQVCEAALIVR